MKRIESRTIHAGWSKTGQGMVPLKTYIKPCSCGNTRHYTRKHRLFWSQAIHAHVLLWGACSFVSFLEFCRASCRACALDVRSYDLSPWSCAQSAASEVGGRPSITPNSRESPPPIFSLTCCRGTAVWRLPFAKEWTTSAAEETHQACGLVTCKLPQCSCGWQGKLGISARIYAQSIQVGAASSARRLFFQRLDISGEVFTTWMISLIEKTKRSRVAMRASAISHKSVQEPNAGRWLRSIMATRLRPSAIDPLHCKGVIPGSAGIDGNHWREASDVEHLRHATWHPFAQHLPPECLAEPAWIHKAKNRTMTPNQILCSALEKNRKDISVRFRLDLLTAWAKHVESFKHISECKIFHIFIYLYMFFHPSTNCFLKFNMNVNAAPLEHVSCTVESGSHLDRPSGTMAVILGPWNRPCLPPAEDIHRSTSLALLKTFQPSNSNRTMQWRVSWSFWAANFERPTKQTCRRRFWLQ